MFTNLFRLPFCFSILIKYTKSILYQYTL
uniref:Uncharacterized protein n=1 Tax=Anguilla anguilla TaxID=7936 RepID=A0A0E9TWP1_ANGAN